MARRAGISVPLRAGLELADLGRAPRKLDVSPPHTPQPPRWGGIHEALRTQEQPPDTADALEQVQGEEPGKGSVYAQFCESYRAWKKRRRGMARLINPGTARPVFSLRANPREDLIPVAGLLEFRHFQDYLREVGRLHGGLPYM